MGELQACLVFRLVQYQVVPKDFIVAVGFNRIYYQLTSFFIFLQCFVHMTIAANRYTAIAKPTIRWEGRRLALVVVAVFLLAFSCTSVRFMMDVRVVDDGEGGYTMMNLNKAADLVRFP